jgi:hypothetical protein
MQPGKDDAGCYASRIAHDGSPEKWGHNASSSKIEAVVMSEVTDWWQLQQSDMFWTRKNKQQEKVGYLFLCAPINSDKPRYRPLPVRYYRTLWTPKASRVRHR